MISERWPLIAQQIEVAEQIEYDNLYLDMNSILHNCSHSNDGEISRLTDEQIFGAIFAYIDHLFNLIKPKKVFYMAIDGVAPRAKMNQQRARRFRSAVEAEEMLQKAIESGDAIPKEPAFDTNAITPGTEFMAKVTENLKFYINQKVSNDKQWQDIEIVLSGHEVPGEGEHKIMEYIRVQKAQDNYNPNTRHCVYGLDADLIILGLVAHEPHFSILREEVTFGRNRKLSTDVSNQVFFLLHISIVRNYLQEEFASLSDEISFEYDFEKVLDDFVLILYVIGNDFLPNLPDLHLNKGAFPLLLHTFKEAMRRTDGYLNERGQINLKRLAVWLDILSIFELENFEEGAIDVEWFNKQLDNVSRRGERARDRQGKELLLKQQKKIVGQLGNWILKVYHENFDIELFYKDESKIPELSLPSEFFESELNTEFIKKFAYELGLFIVHHGSTNTYTAKLDIDGINQGETKEEFDERFIQIKKIIRNYQSGIIVEDEATLRSEEDLYNVKFTEWKDKYYKEKLHFSIKDTDKIVEMTENYIEGLQWVLNYYYKGICSWPWYYRYHYAPRISDLSNGLKVKFSFEMGQPFKPFEQLMSVLPARSKELIPVCYRHLMTDEDSPIIDFYPDDCDIDKNGKNASWEAVVLLSFVDEKRLKLAMEPLNSKLNIEERQRNSFGNDLIYTYNPQISTLIKSPLISVFPDFTSHAIESEYILPSMEGKDFIFGLSKNVLTGKHMISGFPTLLTIPYTSELRKDELVVFQQPTRSESMILTLENEYMNVTPEQFAKLYCNKIVYANWPYLREYQVVFVVDSLMRYEILKNDSKVSHTPMESFEIAEYNKNIEDINYIMHNKKGLRFAANPEEIVSGTKDSKPGKIPKEEIDGLVYVRKVVGVSPTSSGRLVKTYSDKLEFFPIQLIVPSIENADPRFQEKEPVPIAEEFPSGTPVIFLGKAAYGSSAVVIGSEDNKLAIQFNKSDTPEPLFGVDAAKIERESIKYYSAYETSKILGISTFFLSRITSTYMILDNQKKINVGLSLKFEGKGIKTLGYTRKNGRSWEYSAIAISLIKDYLSNFGLFLQALLRYKGNNIPESKELFKNLSVDEREELIRNVKDYLLNKKENFVQVSLNSDSLSRISVSKIESQIIEYTSTPHPTTQLNVKGIPRLAVLNPSIPVLKLKQQQFRLGDRVVYILDSGKVPLFSKGTVIGYKSSDTAVSVSVLFDFPVLTGNTFDGRLKTQRGLSIDSTLLLNITLKQFLYLPKGSTNKTVKQPNNKASDIKKPTSKNGNAKAQTKVEQKSQKPVKSNELEESKKAILSSLFANKKEEKKDKEEVKVAEDTSAPKQLPAAASSDKKNVLNSLVNNVLASTEKAPSAPVINNQMPPNGFPFVIPPMNGFVPPPPGYPMPMIPPNLMYPYNPNMMPIPGPPFPMMGQPPVQGAPPNADAVDGKPNKELSNDIMAALKGVEISDKKEDNKSQADETTNGVNNGSSRSRGNGRGRGRGRGRGSGRGRGRGNGRVRGGKGETN